MPKICYSDKNFAPAALEMIGQANQIIDAYAAQGDDLTLRQLYYVFVSRDLFPASWADPTTGSTNNERSYKKLGSIVNDARLAGLIDWSRITDRTRNLRQSPHWNSPAEIIDACARQFRYKKWADQPCHVEVWVEKDALIGVLESVCPGLDVAYFSCRGYTSQSEMWVAGQRLYDAAVAGKRPVIVHLGDHDPSGIDMSRDIQDRLQDFLLHDWRENQMGGDSYDDDTVWDDVEQKTGGRGVEVRRIALNMAQVRQYNPPPNPAKMTDARAQGYIRAYGNQSWELDALDPPTLRRLITDAVTALRDSTLWRAQVKREQAARDRLKELSDTWEQDGEE